MSNRRDFLKHSALAGASVLLPEYASGQRQIPVEPVFVSVESNSCTISLDYIKGSAHEARKIVIPDVEGFKVLKGDFHIHTLFSDGNVMPDDRVREAKLNNLDIIALSDHIEYRPYFSRGGRWQLGDRDGNDFNIWYEAGKAEAEKNEILWVRAAEITKGTMPPGHFNALFTKDNNPVAAAVDNWEEMLKVAADQGAFLLWNHPGWETSGPGIAKGANLVFTDRHKSVWEKGLMHGIEIFNYYEYYPVVSDWCNKYDLAVMANSDIHASEINTYGMQNLLRPITLVLAREKTLESAREAMFAKRTIGWAANMLWGREPWMEKLFNAVVEIKMISPNHLEFINKSSLPITVSLSNHTFSMKENVTYKAYRPHGVKALTVANWFTAMNKAVEIPLRDK